MTTLLFDESVTLGAAGTLYVATVAYVAVVAVSARSAARRRDARTALAILRHRQPARPTPEQHKPLASPAAPAGPQCRTVGSASGCLCDGAVNEPR